MGGNNGVCFCVLCAYAMSWCVSLPIYVVMVFDGVFWCAVMCGGGHRRQRSTRATRGTRSSAFSSNRTKDTL